MIIFYRIASESPNIKKISLMLEELGLPYAIKNIDPHNNAEWDPEFSRCSPTGTVPAIVDTDTGVGLFESTAILHYLAEKSGSLLPEMIEQRSEVIKWLSFEAANMCPTMIELHHYIMNDDGEVPDIIFQRYKDKLVQYSSILNQQLADRDYLADDYSIADIALFPWTAALEDMAEISLSDYPNLERWATKINLRYNRQQTPASKLAFSNWCYQNGNVAVCSAG